MALNVCPVTVCDCDQGWFWIITKPLIIFVL